MTHSPFETEPDSSASDTSAASVPAPAHPPKDAPPWQAISHQIVERLAALRKHPDGTILTQQSGPHFVVLTKEESEIRLWLMEQNRASTGVVQSEMNLDAPLELVEGYTQAMTLGLLWKPDPERVFFSGLGGGRVPLVFHALLPNVQIFAAEIDPKIIEIAQRHFGLAIGDRITVDLADGRQWMEQRVDLFDIIVVDVFLDNGYTPYRQATAEFYTLCRARLEPDGVLVINLLENDPYTARKIATLQTIFAHVYYVPVDEENTIIFATDNHQPHPANTRKQAEELDAHWRLPFPFCQMANRIQGDLTRFSDALDALEPLYDATPPEDYFRLLPSLTSAFQMSHATLPCPCGSGLAYGICHGTLNAPNRAPSS